MPYENLFTRMKSPTSRVGFIDPEGIWNGSTRNERSTSTMNSTGKNDLPYSTSSGSLFRRSTTAISGWVTLPW
ncbi:hypothetical protein D3C78_1743880 [compost metagenome]